MQRNLDFECYCALGPAVIRRATKRQTRRHAVVPAAAAERLQRRTFDASQRLFTALGVGRRITQRYSQNPRYDGLRRWKRARRAIEVSALDYTRALQRFRQAIQKCLLSGKA